MTYRAGRQWHRQTVLPVALVFVLIGCREPRSGDTAAAPNARTTALGHPGEPGAGSPSDSSDSLRVETRIGPGGGEIRLGGFGAARFATGVLATEAVVSLAATRSATTARDFDETIPVDPAGRAPWELRLNVGPAAPADSVDLSIEIPQGFGAGREIMTFAQIYQDSEQDLLDGFIPVKSTTSAGKMSLRLPPEAFTDQRGSNESFEAIVVLVAVRSAR